MDVGGLVLQHRNCEFEALIGAQGIRYRLGVWARSRRCIALNGSTAASIALTAMIIVTTTVGLPMLILSTEHDLARLIHL